MNSTFSSTDPSNNEIEGCKGHTCVHKCCGENKHYNLDGTKCIPDFKKMDIQKYIQIYNGTVKLSGKEPLLVEPDKNWCNYSISLNPKNNKSETWKLQKSGELFLPHSNNPKYSRI